MPRRANIRRRRRTEKGRKRVAPQQELKRLQESAKEKESNESVEMQEVRARIAEQGCTIVVPNDGLDFLFEARD